MNIAIIPARGGSKRISKKNIREFLGRPVISYSIEIANKSGLFERIIVSTDNDEIAEIAIKNGAEVPFKRPKNLSDDHTSTHDVISHAVNWLINLGVKMDYVCSIYPAAPLIQLEDLVKGLELISKGNWESVFAATNFSYPIFRSFHYDKNELRHLGKALNSQAVITGRITDLGTNLDIHQNHYRSIDLNHQGNHHPYQHSHHYQCLDNRCKEESLHFRRYHHNHRDHNSLGTSGIAPECRTTRTPPVFLP